MDMDVFCRCASKSWRPGLVLVITLFFSAIVTSRPVWAANSTWQRSQQLPVPFKGHMLYGGLGGSGSAAWFTFSLTEPTTVDVALSVPAGSSKNFQPRLVVYQPESMTVGPVLPISQPPNTAALIYRSTEGPTTFDIVGFVEQQRKLQATLTLPAAGRYYLAVYNAGQASGRWRLQLGQASPAVATLTRWPIRWWQDQAWAGWTTKTLFLPFWVVALIVWWGLMFHRRSHRSRL